MAVPRSIAATVLVLSLGFAVVATLAIELHQVRASIRQEALGEAQAATHAAADALERNQQGLVRIVRGLVADLGSGDLGLADLSPRLDDELRRAQPQVFTVTVVFPARPDEALIAPIAMRTAEGPQVSRLDQVYDLRGSAWYRDVSARPELRWHGPMPGPASGHFLALYCEPWSAPDHPGLLGHVCSSWSLYEVEAQRRTLPAGRFGYTWLLSHETRSLAHPYIDWVRSARTPEQVADEGGDAGLREVARRAIAGEAGATLATDPLTGRGAVMFQAPIPTSGWSLVAVVLQDDILAAEPSLRRRQIMLAVVVLSTLAAAAAILLFGGRR